MRPQKIPNVFGQPSNPYYTHLLPANNFHLPYHNLLANSLASFFYQKIVSLKDSIALKLQGSPTPFDFDLPHSGEVLFRFQPRHPCRSIPITSINVKQIVSAWLHPDITSKIMWQHFFYPHLSLGKPILHPGHFSFQIQTGTYFTSPGKNLVYQNQTSQISDQYPIWIPSEKSSSV